MKYSRSQLKEVKKALKAQKEKDHLEQTPPIQADESSVSLAEARAIARSMVTEEEQIEKSEAYNTKRAARQEARQLQEVTVDWQVAVGDAVMFDTAGDTQFGIVVDCRKGVARNKKSALRSGGIKVMSAGGQYWVKPTSVTKIED